MDEETGLSVLLEHRPRCIAFLVDLDSATDALVDAIVDFNVDCWGGRFNPIIPTRSRKICPDYWRLLKLSDADLIYSYGDLDSETVERLDRELGPIHIVRNLTERSENPRDYRPSSLDDQPSTKGVLLQLRDLVPPHFRRPKEPSVLTFDVEHNDERRISSFIRRNFGVSHNAYFAARDEGVSATYPKSFSDADILQCLEQTRNLLLPIKLSAKGASRQQALTTHREEFFQVVYGEHIANAIYYWNRAYFRGIPNYWHAGIDDMWLRPSVIADSAAYESLARVIRRLVFTTGQRGLRIVSCDHDVAELDELARKLSTDVRTNLIASRAEKFAPDFFPECSAVKPLEFLPARPSHQFVKGKRFYVGIERPEDLLAEPDQHWMLRLRIEDPTQEKPFVNTKPWWALPQKQSLARLFAGRYRRCRVGSSGELIFEVSSREENCEITIPEKHPLFSALLLPEAQYWTVDDLRQGIPREASHTAIASSEQGKYLNGLSTLFGSIRATTYYFDHPFWLLRLTELCRPEISAHVKHQVKVTIEEQAASFLSDYQNDRESASEWFAEEMIHAGQKIPRAENFLRFDRLKKAHEAFDSNQSTEFERERAADIDLRAGLSDLCEAGVLLQGFEILCPHCMSRFWYHIDDAKTLVTCFGCRQKIPLPTETPWVYKPNELLWKAIRFYGLVSVIRTIRRLFDETKNSFIFASGIVFYDYQIEPPKKTAELDLAWMRDGEFGIAEIKQSAGMFKTKDCERIISLAKATLPTNVLLVAMEGDDSKMSRWQKLVDNQLSPLGIKTEILAPSDFARPSHYVW